MRSSAVLALGLFAASTNARTIELAAGADFEAECLMVVEPGDVCSLAKGDYPYDGITQVHGTESAPITITGHPEACIKGSNTQDRVLQIAHDYYIVDGICFDGDHGGEYVATGLYVLGAELKHGITVGGVDVTSSVTGLKLRNLEIKNFGSECVHFRYFVTWAEVEGCTIQNCGYDAFHGGGGGKVGEGIYVGTALDQVDDGKAPEPKLWTGSADNVDYDECSYNWFHHNTFRTYGNECIDVKEGSHHNLIENNVCEQQLDEYSGGFDLRGDENTVRYNEIAECVGAGVRIGGDQDFGSGNHIYGNVIKNVNAGAFDVMMPNQGVVCENVISGSTSAEGTYKSEPQFEVSVSTGPCDSYPGDLGGSAGSEEEPESAPETTTDDDISAGVNYVDSAEQSEPVTEVVETNESEGTSGQGQCTSVLKVVKVEVEHPEYADHYTDHLFDADLETYFSVNRESTKLTFELEGDNEVNGVAIGFFMKAAEEERIQVFDIALKAQADDSWTTVLSRKESSGAYQDIQTFPFTGRTASYVRFESHGNSFNNWTPLTEIEICGAEAEVETNALFNAGVDAVHNDIKQLNGALVVCPTAEKLAPVKTRLFGGTGNVESLFDGNFQTRWSTDNTAHENDLDNDMIQLILQGDSYITSVKMAFFDGNLAHQHFSVYTQSATAKRWSEVLVGQLADKHERLQAFPIDVDRVTNVYIVGNGNDVGDFTKISEVELWGC